MILRIIGFIAISIILYSFGISIAGDDSDRINIKLNKFFKFLFGFYFYSGFKFGLRGVVFQSLNLLGVILYCFALFKYNDISLAVQYSRNVWIINFIITGVISVLARRSNI